MKRNTAIVLVLLANIVLLAHAVIPHHHHDSALCFSTTHENTCCEHDHGDSHEHHHHSPISEDANHDSDTDHDFVNCLLNQVFLIPSNHLNLESKTLDFDLGVDFVSTDIRISTNNNIAYYSWIKEFPPLLEHSYPLFIQRSIGLRGPPQA